MHLQYGSMRLDTVRVCQDLSFDTFPTNRDGCVMHELGVTTGSTVDNPVLQSQMEVYRDSMGFRDFWLNMYIYIYNSLAGDYFMYLSIAWCLPRNFVVATMHLGVQISNKDEMDLCIHSQ